MKLKIGRSTNSSVRRKSQPMPPVPETLFHLVGSERVSTPLLATNVGS